MSSMIFSIILIIIWIYAIYVFRRGNLAFFEFIIGSIGVFLILLNLTNYFKNPIISGFTYLLGVVGNLTGVFEGYASYGMFFIDHKDTVISLYIDLECSGLIEMMVFISLISFFPVYNLIEKIKIGITGCVFICIFNFIRILSIILLIYQFGSPVYALAHSIVGRLVFYVLVISLYFYIFTKGQLERQKVGNFDYES